MDFHRFFVPVVKVGLADLPEDQAHHALHVLRLETGAEVEVFDGKGTWGRGVLQAAKRQARVEVLRVEFVAQTARLTVATAVPKADRAEWLVEQASQLNVAVIQWLSADR